MFKSLNLRKLSNIVIIYLLLAFIWWAMLLHLKNRDAFQAKAELMGIGMAAEGIIKTREDLLEQPQYQELKRKYEHQEWMIYGEGLVFIVSLIYGIYMINKSHFVKVNSEQQTRNFLLSITHELKSPLASIRLALETIEKRELPRETIVKLSKNAIKESDRLTSLVNDLLLAAKVEGVYDPLMEQLDIHKILQDAVEIFRQKNPSATVQLLGPNQPVYISGDRQGITSVCDNLIENGIKYSFDNPNIVITLLEKDSKVVINFADNGIGIADEEKKNVFEKFYRVGNEDTRKTKGTGLGLYIVSEIIKFHKGKITIADNTPNGTVFKIVLPKIA